MECTPKQLENGRTKEESLVLEPLLDNEELLSMKKQKVTKKGKQSKLSIAECRATNKKTTCKDKSHTCKKSSRATKSSKTSAPVSTSGEKVFSPFWTNVCLEMSKKLWSPAETDFVDLPSNCYNGLLRDKEPNLPFWSKVMKVQNPNSPTMSFPSFKFFAVGEMAKEDTLTRVLKVKVRMTTRQKAVVRRWEAGYRFTYNKGLDYLRKNPKTSKLTLRNMIVTKSQNKKTIEKAGGLFGNDNINPFIASNKWLLKVPKDIRQQAAFELHKNWRLAKNNCGYKVRDNNKGWVISIEQNHISVLGNKKIKLYSGDTKLTIRAIGDLPKWLIPSEFEDSITPPCQVMLQKRGKSYYMLFPYKVEKTVKREDYEGHIAALDPGIRKFITSYGTDGRVGFFGSKNPVNKLKKIEWFKDVLRTRIEAPKKAIYRVSGKERKNARRKFRKLQERIENIRKDYHHKVANWFTKTYHGIVIGKLPKGIISRDKSLPKVVKRAYNSLAHYKFRCCLKEKCIKRGVIFQEINESYTSKTCCCCGKINNVGSSEVYSCACSPGVFWDRDVNGAKNILLKSFSESYLRIVLKDKTLSLKQPQWTNYPRGCSWLLSILKEY